jgi:hypothetical protein
VIIFGADGCALILCAVVCETLLLWHCICRFPYKQSLHAIAGVARSRAREWEENAITEPDTAAYYVREQSCPKQYTDSMKQAE